VAGCLCYQRNRGETDISVSPEAIYTWIYALPKGELAEMGIALRSGRDRRKPQCHLA
jgi:IS30 family transposase